MDDYDQYPRIRPSPLHSSSCTPVHLEGRRRQLIRAWHAIHAARKRLAHSKQIWFDDAPPPLNVERRFCFVLRRMKRKWREADRAADLSGLAVHLTVGSTKARRDWFSLLTRVLDDDNVIRIRHRYYDEPAVLISESRFRNMEGAETRFPARG